MKRAALYAVSLGVLVLPLAACGADSLEDRDPAGARACDELVASRDPDADIEEVLGRALFLIGEEASEATTPAISDTAQLAEGPLQDLLPDDDPIWDVDLDALEEACEAEGYDVPPVPDRS